jgi:putative flippase GtrA
MRSLLLAVIRRPEVRYLFFGGLNTAFSYGLFTIALLILHSWRVPGDYAIAITFSWLVSNATSFYLQRRYVFRARGHLIREFVRFTSVTFGSFLANLGLSTIAVTVLGLTGQTEKLVSQLVITVVLVVVTYILHRSFSFRQRKEGGADGDDGGSAATPHRPADPGAGETRG